MTTGSRPASRDRQFGRLLCAKSDAGASGIVTGSRGRLRRLFCFSGGSLAFATSNLLEEQFVAYLIRSKALSAEAGAEVVAESARVNAKPLAYLLASQRRTAEELRPAMEGLVRELVDSTVEWPDGSFEFEEGAPRLDGEITVRLAPRALVLAHAHRYPATIEALRKRIGPPDLRPVVTPSAGDGGLGFDAVGAFLVTRCDGSHELSAIVAESPAGEEATLRTMYGFLLAGILDAEDPETLREREGQGGELKLTREECLGRLAMVAGQDHYGVLGVDRTARPKAIREAYYALARRYHPDRFRSGPLSNLLQKFEEFFVLVTEAHNTLADRDRRKEYDAELAAAEVSVDTKGADTGYLARQNYLRGRALAEQRKYTEAVKFLENAVSLDPGQADFRFALGLVLSRNPRHREEAERHLLQVVEMAPAKVGAYVALGQMYFKAGRLGPAGRMAREALRWEPGHLEASTLLAEAGDAPDEHDTLKRGVFRSS